MFKLCVICVAIFAIFPYLSNAVCCRREKIYFQKVEYSSTCRNFGGLIPLSEVKVLYPFIFEDDYFEKHKDCEIMACGDGKPHIGQVYCGKGSCNIFGCNCDGGCIEGNALESFKSLYKNRVTNVRL